MPWSGPRKGKNTHTQCLGINLAKHQQDLYAENQETPVKEVKEPLGESPWRDCPWAGKLNRPTMPALPNLIYSFNAVPAKAFLVDIDKLVTTFIRHVRALG